MDIEEQNFYHTVAFANAGASTIIVTHKIKRTNITSDYVFNEISL